ncbi:MAG: hypothetical protein ABWJ97_02785 [Thermoproteus sp.]
MRGVLFLGRESELADRLKAVGRIGIKVVLMPGRDAVLYTYDERRGGSIMLEGEELLEYLQELYGLSLLSSSS